MKKGLIAAAVVVILAMAAVVVYLLMDNRSLEQEKLEMQELAELDKQEMENDYERLSLQYSEMMTQINNDSIVA
jgi:cell division protein FtsL